MTNRMRLMRWLGFALIKFTVAATILAAVGHAIACPPLGCASLLANVAARESRDRLRLFTFFFVLKPSIFFPLFVLFTLFYPYWCISIRFRNIYICQKLSK